MNTRRKSLLKDKILVFVNEQTKRGSVYDIAKFLKEDVKLIAYLSEELQDDELVQLTEVASKSSEIPSEYLVSKTNKGVYFISFDGGFFQRYIKERIFKIWTVIKIVAAVINAVTILVLGIYSVYLTDKSDKLERENEILRIELKKNEDGKSRFK